MKSASPIRLQSDLMKAATITGAQAHRTPPEQIEYWASLGRSVESVLSMDAILAVRAGLAKLKLEAIKAEPVDPEAVFASLEEDRQSGLLANDISSASVRYQASTAHPGMLEQIDINGHVTLGQFNDGHFVAQVAE